MNWPLTSNRSWGLTAAIALIAGVTGSGVIGSGQAAAQEAADSQVQAYRNTIARALCFNEWELAVDLTTRLMLLDTVDSAYRTELVAYRNQIETWARTGQPVRFQGCDAAIAASMAALETAQQQPTESAPSHAPSLDWAGAYDALLQAEQSE